MSRYKNYRLVHEESKTDSELIKLLHEAAVRYERYLNQNLIFIFHESAKNPVYDYYEVYFGKENFIHLAGFARGDISASEFFDKCLSGSILLKEVRFSENRKSASAKLGVLSGLLDYRHTKVYRIGNADLITLKNRFELAVGHGNGLMGFDQRSSTGLPVPVTVLNRSITDFVSTPQILVVVLAKSRGEKYYTRIIGCPNSGFPIAVLPEGIRKKISPDLTDNLVLQEKSD